MKRLFIAVLVLFSISALPCVAQNRRTLIFENQYIQVYSNETADDLADFTSSISARAGEILEKYDSPSSGKISIALFPSLEELHLAMGVPDAPDWVVGVSSSVNWIMMVNPFMSKKYSYEEMEKVAIHEYSHQIISRLNKKIPRWLQEGIAMVEANQPESRADLRDMASCDSLPLFREFDGYIMDDTAYYYSKSLVEFIIDKFSMEKLREFIKNPSILAVFGLSDDDFQEGWRQYLIEWE